MRRLKRLALLLCALLLTAAGAALPYMLSAIQDAQVEGMSETRQFDPVSLTLMKGEGVQEVLQLLAGSTSELAWQGTTKLTESGAVKAAQEAIQQLNESGLVSLIPEDLLTYGFSMHVKPHIIMSMNESNVSAVVWVCWLEEIPANWFFIDDETGKIVRFFLNDTELAAVEDVEVYNSASVAGEWDTEQWEDTMRLAEQWRVFLSEYYGMDLQFGDTEPYDDGYSMYVTFLFDAGGQEGKGKVTFEIHGRSVYFNV